MLSPAEFVQACILVGCMVLAVFLTVLQFRAWRGDRYLCDDCKYNNDTDCLKPERPKATECTAYRRKGEQ